MPFGISFIHSAVPNTIGIIPREILPIMFYSYIPSKMQSLMHKF